MIPHKTARGAAAMERLKTFEGVPQPYDHMKRVVVPQALRVLRLKPGRKYCTVGRLGHEFGWKYQDVVSRCVYLRIPEIAGGQSLTGVTQARGEEEGQGRCLLRAQEGHQETALGCPEDREGRREGQDSACRVRLLDSGYGHRWHGSFKCKGSGHGSARMHGNVETVLKLLFSRFRLAGTRKIQRSRLGGIGWICSINPNRLLKNTYFAVSPLMACGKISKNGILQKPLPQSLHHQYYGK